MQHAKPLTFKEQAVLIQQKHNQQPIWLDNILDNPVALAIIGLAHIGLAMAVRETNADFLGTAHGLGALLLGIIFASNKRYPVVYAVYMAVYIAGCEVMWRQNKFTLFHESGKYFTIIILLITWLRTRNTKVSMPIILYVVFLTPGIFFTVAQLQDLKGVLSPNATGPAAIFVALLFYSTQKFTTTDLRRILSIAVLPVIGIGGVVLYRLINLDITWTGDSNNEVSGDFGANQVSTALGFGWFFLLVVVLLLANRKQLVMIGLFLGTAVWLIAMNFFTFSRGGLIGSIVSLGICILFMFTMRNKRTVAFLTVAIGIIIIVILFPVLNETTQGNLARRYLEETDQETLLTNRDKLMREEINLFLENPITGIGLGRGKQVRGEQAQLRAISHTEYTRLLAEHGIFGLAVNILFFIIAVQAYMKQENPTGRALSAAFIFWGLFYMFHAATRTVEPAMMLGLGSALLAVDLNPATSKGEAAKHPNGKRSMPKLIPAAVNHNP